MSDNFRVHFIVPVPDGPLESGPVQALGDGKILQVSTGGRFAAACGAKVDGVKERGSGEPWACRCKDCISTAIFQQLKRPKPGRGSPSSSEVVDNGCCG